MDATDVVEQTPSTSAIPPPTTPRADHLAPDAVDHSPKLEKLAEQILQELKRRNEAPHTDFSISKLFAGIVQILALAALFLAYLNHGAGPSTQVTLLFAIFLEALTIALLIMARQR